MSEKQKVSDEIAKALDSVSALTGLYSDQENKIAVEKAESEGFTASRCTWWGGCYYCNDGNGWYLVYCIA